MRLALLQMQSVPGDRAGNLARIAAAAEAEARRGAELLVCPELAVTGYGAGPDFADLAEPADGPSAQALAGIAARTGIGLVCGLALREGGAVFNAALFTDGLGPATIYRKSHLYGAYERAHFSAGPPAAVTFAHRGRRLGLLICYDVEFPENVRRLARAGAEIVAVPTALPDLPSADMVSARVVPVRAFENHLFIAYAGLCGQDRRFRYAGLSCIAAPDGGTLARAGREGGTLSATLRPGDFAAARAENPYLDDLRS